MNTKQQTIQKSVSVSGVGLHTGVSATMTFLPAPTNHGYKFQRIDLPGQPIVDADVDNVVDLSRGTTIEQSGARIHTVEHTLAALVGLQTGQRPDSTRRPRTSHYGWFIDSVHRRPARRRY